MMQKQLSSLTVILCALQLELLPAETSRLPIPIPTPNPETVAAWVLLSLRQEGPTLNIPTSNSPDTMVPQADTQTNQSFNRAVAGSTIQKVSKKNGGKASKKKKSVVCIGHCGRTFANNTNLRVHLERSRGKDHPSTNLENGLCVCDFEGCGITVQPKDILRHQNQCAKKDPKRRTTHRRMRELARCRRQPNTTTS